MAGDISPIRNHRQTPLGGLMNVSKKKVRASVDRDSGWTSPWLVGWLVGWLRERSSYAVRSNPHGRKAAHGFVAVSVISADYMHMYRQVCSKYVLRQTDRQTDRQTEEFTVFT